VRRLSFLLAAALSLALLPFPAFAADPTGTVEICRVRAAGDRHEGEDIAIPSGATFGDAGVIEGDQHTGNYWPLWIATTQPLTIGGNDKCVRGPARIVADLDKHSLHAADHRWFVPSGTATSSDKWPGDYDVAATVTSDFK
jgi:hypothetical protein